MRLPLRGLGHNRGFGGDFIGSPVMFETAGRQYLLVPAAGTPPRGAGAAPTGPLGWIAYALPLK